MLVGVRRALALAEPAERAADVQTFDTLMLRLTTNVTVSPASSSRSSSAASRISSIASGRVSANSAVSSSGLSAIPSRPFAIAPATRSGLIGAGGSVRRSRAVG